ncbi:hypothetical protein ANCCAN_25433 [Ancylostoma caninum]|uniref:Uncharacterized protein n=1 Tax=Ancylostoma caninum TaxID=29170 RepID=A0A368F9U1_ANCCA|nr:hypothetical protein ANCCAN_25433 [Ancylostoma caninum]
MNGLERTLRDLRKGGHCLYTKHEAARNRLQEMCTLRVVHRVLDGEKKYFLIYHPPHKLELTPKPSSFSPRSPPESTRPRSTSVY